MGQLLNKVKDSDMFSHLSSMGYLPRWLVLMLDVLLCFCAYILAYQFAYHYYYFKFADVELYRLDNILVTISCQIVWFWVFHTYSGIVRYSTFVDIVKIFSAVVVNVALLFLVHFVVYLICGELMFLRLGIVFYGVFAFLLLMLLRVSVKTMYDVFVVRKGSSLPVVVYGTKSAGVSIAKMLRSETDSR